jgi:hypothetical protein
MFFEKAKRRSWLRKQRARAEEYLWGQDVDHAGVAEEPSFDVHPYLALFAVNSKRYPGRIGWWVIVGDIPADYISSAERKTPRDAIRGFAELWLEVSDYMLRGKEHPELRFGDPDHWPTLGEHLQSRAEMLRFIAKDDDYWWGDTR